MSFTSTVYDAQTHEPIPANADPLAYDTYTITKCDLDGSPVHVQRVGASNMTAHCERGHCWVEVETLDAATGRRLSEGGSWRQVE